MRFLYARQAGREEWERGWRLKVPLGRYWVGKAGWGVGDEGEREAMGRRRSGGGAVEEL